MSSLVFRDREGDFAGLGSFTAQGHLTELTRGSGPKRDLPQTLREFPNRSYIEASMSPSRTRHAMHGKTGRWGGPLQSREGMRIEISPKSTHGCPNSLFLRF